MRKHLLLASLGILAAAAIGGCDTMAADHAHADMHASMWGNINRAVAVLYPTKSAAGASATPSGTITFEQTPAGVHVTGTINGLAPNSTHGFHIHEFGDASSDNGSAAGGHYNPESHQHGAPDDSNHHAGDLGNVTADGSGTAKIDLTLKDISIAGMKNPIVGRGLVLHAAADDLKSQSPPAPSPGNSGARIAVGVIGIGKNP